MNPTTHQPAAGVYNGIYTLFNPASGQHRTFRIRTWVQDDGHEARVVGLLTGPENTTDYTDFGFVRDDGRGIVVWKKWRGIGEYEAYARCFWSMLVDGPQGPYASRGVTVRASRTCLRCNRVLTTPESIRDGMGPECAG